MCLLHDELQEFRRSGVCLLHDELQEFRRSGSLHQLTHGTPRQHVYVGKEVMFVAVYMHHSQPVMNGPGHTACGAVSVFIVV